jgi:glutaredoxin 2
MIFIAKKNKIKNWKLIWKHQKNKSIVGKRKKPENIQAGDVFYIPPTADYVKAAEKAILVLSLVRQDMIVQWRYVEGLIAAYEINIRYFEAYIKKCEKLIAKYLQSLKASRKKVKKISTTVETVQGVVQMARGLNDLGKKAYKSTKLDGKELRNLNKEVLAGLKKKLFWGTLDTSRKLVVLTKGTMLEPVHILNESWDKVNSWNHWFMTVAALAEGKSWYEAVTFDIDEAFENHIGYITIHTRKMFTEFRAEIARQKKVVKALKNDIGVLKKAIKASEERADYFYRQIEGHVK